MVAMECTDTERPRFLYEGLIGFRLLWQCLVIGRSKHGNVGNRVNKETFGPYRSLLPKGSEQIFIGALLCVRRRTARRKEWQAMGGRRLLCSTTKPRPWPTVMTARLAKSTSTKNLLSVRSATASPG